MPLRIDVAKTEQRYLLDMIDVTDKHILEIGCGDGRLTWRYADTARHVVCIDVDLEELQTALSKRDETLSKTVDFMAGSAIVMPFAANTFDHVIFAWSF